MQDVTESIARDIRAASHSPLARAVKAVPAGKMLSPAQVRVLAKYSGTRLPAVSVAPLYGFRPDPPKAEHKILLALILGGKMRVLRESGTLPSSDSWTRQYDAGFHYRLLAAEPAQLAPSASRHERGENPRTGSKPWEGIAANEKAFHSVRNALVGIYLDGVQGVSPDLGRGRQVPVEDADRYLDRARRVLADFEAQSLAPGGARGRAQRWMSGTKSELRRLLSQAEAVRSGASPGLASPGASPSASKHERGENPLTKRQFDALTKKLGGTGRGGRSGLARDEIDAYRRSRGLPLRGSGATESTTRRDLLAERASERRRSPDVPLRALQSAPKRIGGSAFLRSWGEPIQRPFAGDPHGLSLMSRAELKAYRGGAGKKDAALKARIDKLLGKK